MNQNDSSQYKGCRCGQDDGSSRYAYFPGCTIPARLNSYELSSRKILEKLGVELVNLEGASCCGMPLERVDHESFMLMVAKVLSEAERQDVDILTLCSGCFGSLSRGAAYLTGHQAEWKRVNASLKDFNLEYRATGRIRHLIQVLYEEIGAGRIKNEVKRSLKGMRIAAHYGCHPLKPHGVVKFDDPEEPRSLDELINATGAESVEYKDKLQCCGSPILATDENLAMAIAKSKLDNMKAAKVDAMVTICPFCELMLDGMQIVIAERYKEGYNIPALFLPQLLGLSMDMKATDLGMNMNKVSAEKLLQRII